MFFRPTASLSLVALCLLCCGLVYAAAARFDPEKPAPSTYAPVKDLQAQFDYFMEKVEEDLADEDGYGDDQAGRVGKNSTSLSAIALVLAKHDQANSMKKSASYVLEAAEELAGASDDFDDATEAFADLKAALKKEKSKTVKWEPAVDMTLMMEQVPIVNNSLSRGVLGRRFERMADRNAGSAATLAAMAQASAIDDSYCGDDEELQQWQQYCIDMRDAAAAINKAARAGDQEAAKKALDKMDKACTGCHDVFN